MYSGMVPLGAYDHPTSHDYAEGSLELAQLLFEEALTNPKFSVVIGGGDSAAILNKIGVNQLKKPHQALYRKATGRSNKSRLA